jgi:hypothetical protein
MKDDVRRVVRRAGWEPEDYREVAAGQQEEEAARNWPLIAAVNRALAGPATAPTSNVAPVTSVAAVPATPPSARELSTRTVVQWGS